MAPSPTNLRTITAGVKRYFEQGFFYNFKNKEMGVVHTRRTRFTIAQVNAGATILPAIPGFCYRLVSCKVIAVGGAVTTVTTVDILATLAATSRKLVAYSQASMTQSTQVAAGNAGGAILADGASYTANDKNTAITINITGSAITVATHVDVIIDYMIEKA
jgi:hypothetical protein